MLKYLLSVFLLLIIEANAFSQLHYISGNVKDESGNVLPGAEVFLNGTSRLTQTNGEGVFTISRLVSGNYELVVKLLGRKTYQASFTLSKSSKFNIVLALKSQQLDEVVIKPRTNNPEAYAKFLRYFIGQSPNAQHCKIINPEILNIYTDPLTKKLEVNSGGEFLNIENRALGYTTLFLLEEFILDEQEAYSYYLGQVTFRPMSGTESKMRNWIKARNMTYLGSSPHFLKSVYDDNLEQAGFIIRKLVKTQNADRPPDDLIERKLTEFSNPHGAKGLQKEIAKDSLYFWRMKAHLPRMIQTLMKDTIKADTLLTNAGGLNKKFQFKDHLHIVYHELPALGYNQRNSSVMIMHEDGHSQTSLISIRDDIPLIDASGNLANPTSILYNGYMAWERIADLLPRDFR